MDIYTITSTMTGDMGGERFTWVNVEGAFKTRKDAVDRLSDLVSHDEDAITGFCEAHGKGEIKTRRIDRRRGCAVLESVYGVKYEYIVHKTRLLG